MEISKDLYPFEHNWLDLNGQRLHYLDEGPQDGRGAPVLMVHGNPSWSFYYRNLVQTLRATHRCIVPDHIGCGFSDKPGDADYNYTLSQRVSDLTTLMDSLQLNEPLTLVVHDWGGLIGMTWALAHADQVARIVLLNTSAFPLPQDKRMPFALWLVRNTALGSLLVNSANAFAAGAARWGVTKKPMAAEVRRAYVAPYDSKAHRIATLRFVQDIPLKPGDPAWEMINDTAARLGELADKPALICWGEKDFVFDHHFLARWRKEWPEARVCTYPNAGHYVLEDESDAICAEVQSFLAKTES